MPGVDVRVVLVEGLPALPPVETIVDPSYAAPVRRLRLQARQRRHALRRAPRARAPRPRRCWSACAIWPSARSAAFPLRDVAVAQLPRRRRRRGVVPQHHGHPELRPDRRPLHRHARDRRATTTRPCSPCCARRRRATACSACSTPPSRARRARARTSLRVGLAFNMKRIDSHAGDDREAEYDAPETIQAITAGHREPRPRRRAARGDAGVPARAHDVERRRRLQHRRGDVRPQPRGAGAEPLRAARHPLHRQRLGDALALPRQGARASDCWSTSTRPRSRCSSTGREKLRPFRYPVIVKPNQEGTSKGITQEERVRRRGAACARSRASSSSATASRRWSRSTSPGASSPWACSASDARACCRRWRSSSSTQSERPGLRLRVQAALASSTCATSARRTSRRTSSAPSSGRAGRPS